MTVTVLKALNGNVAVMTSSDMLISKINIATFYNDLIYFIYVDHMFSGTKNSIWQAETYFILLFSPSNKAATAILKFKISIGS